MIDFTHWNGILLKVAVEPLLDLAKEATVTYDRDAIYLTASDNDCGGVLAVLRLDCVHFDSYYCEEFDYKKINLRDLLVKLNIADDGESTRVYSVPEKNTIQFEIRIAGSCEIEFSKMKLSEAKHEDPHIYASFIYSSIEVSIIACKFERSLSICYEHSSDACFRIRKNQMEIISVDSSYYEEIETDEYVIKGVEKEDDPTYFFLIPHPYMHTLIKASRLSESVSMLVSVDDHVPDALSFRIPWVGELVFYFLQTLDC